MVNYIEISNYLYYYSIYNKKLQQYEKLLKEIKYGKKKRLTFIIVLKLGKN